MFGFPRRGARQGQRGKTAPSREGKNCSGNLFCSLAATTTSVPEVCPRWSEQLFRLQEQMAEEIPIYFGNRTFLSHYYELPEIGPHDGESQQRCVVSLVDYAGTPFVTPLCGIVQRGGLRDHLLLAETVYVQLNVGHLPVARFDKDSFVLIHQTQPCRTPGDPLRQKNVRKSDVVHWLLALRCFWGLQSSKDRRFQFVKVKRPSQNDPNSRTVQDACSIAVEDLWSRGLDIVVPFVRRGDRYSFFVTGLQVVKLDRVRPYDPSTYLHPAPGKELTDQLIMLISEMENYLQI